MMSFPLRVRERFADKGLVAVATPGFVTLRGRDGESLTGAQAGHGAGARVQDRIEQVRGEITKF